MLLAYAHLELCYKHHFLLLFPASTSYREEQRIGCSRLLLRIMPHESRSLRTMGDGESLQPLQAAPGSHSD